MAAYNYIGGENRTPGAFNAFQITKDGVKIDAGSFMYYDEVSNPHGSTPEMLVSPYETPGNTVYVNASLVYPASNQEGCTPGTTRQGPCPNDPKKLVTQECIQGSWVTSKVDENKCAGEDPAKIIVVVVILAFVLIYLGSRA